MNISDYYITDSNTYYNLPSESNFWSGSVHDFIARFPDSYSIEPNTYLTIGVEVILLLILDHGFQDLDHTHPCHRGRAASLFRWNSI